MKFNNHEAALRHVEFVCKEVAKNENSNNSSLFCSRILEVNSVHLGSDYCTRNISVPQTIGYEAQSVV